MGERNRAVRFDRQKPNGLSVGRRAWPTLRRSNAV
jgi:hypothetical protein